jgi:ubiquinone biosynthesis protein
VVEGVARSLHPQINIWEVAHPIVEEYIKQSIGPRALINDLLKTARVLSRFGPKLPQLAEAALIRTYNTSQQRPATHDFKKSWILLALIGAATFGWIAAHLT